ncbi:hypothetical protein MesoLj113a_03560 [Mesorhizobium sp. 113-1-2]|nr:hypothetical protein MesoLj113a_03560 [Mesorhizobium sp. 113-1-2]
MSEGLNDFVIHGRSKERSDAAQTPGAAPQPKGSMPDSWAPPRVQNSAPLHSSTKITEWIPGFPRRSCAPASPRDDEAERLPLITNDFVSQTLVKPQVNYRISIALRSFTFVPVGPGTKRSPTA